MMYLRCFQKLAHRFVVLILIGLCANVSSAEDTYENRYDWFAKEGVYDVSLTNNEANKLVSNAIFSKDTKAIEQAVRGMGMLAAWVETNTSYEGGTTPPMRHFHRIAGIKVFLMDYWRTGLANERLVTGEFSSEVDPILPGWQIVPTILAAYFPRDTHVILMFTISFGKYSI